MASDHGGGSGDTTQFSGRDTQFARAWGEDIGRSPTDVDQCAGCPILNGCGACACMNGLGSAAYITVGGHGDVSAIAHHASTIAHGDSA